MRPTILLAAPFLISAFSPILNRRNQIQHQTPLITPAMPPTPDNADSIILSDVLGGDKSINIFAGFTRDFAPISARFEDSSQNTTILAPMNSAIMSLPRKPWENQEGQGEDEERAKENLRRFVEAHVVPVSPWKENVKVETLAGGEIWWELKEGKKVIQPGGIEVSAVASTVFNGEVWILKGVRNYA